MLMYVTHYESWQKYGGPEEGGWWYHQTAAHTVRAFRRPAKARRYLAWLRRRLIAAHTFYRHGQLLAGERPSRAFDPRRDRWPLNQYDEGHWAAIERTPRAAQDLHRHRYE